MMSVVATVGQQKFFDLQLPETVRLRSGAIFFPNDEHWKFVDGIYSVYMNFMDLPSQVRPLIPYAKHVLINFLEMNAPTHAVNMFRSFLRLANVIEQTATSDVNQVTEAHVLNFVSTYNNSLGLGAHLSALIMRWDELGIPGIDKHAVELLQSMRKQGNIKGEAVLTLDPVNGPLTDFEVQQLTQALNLAYADGNIDPKFYFLTWLAILTGQRASQYCALKVCDVIEINEKYGDVSYEIQIPKAKQRSITIRDEFLVRPLLRQFGEALFAYANDVRNELPHLGENAPLFPTNVKSRVVQLDSGFEKHWTPSALATAFGNAFANLAPISPRTSEPMHLAIGRFRDTLGTRAAQEGFGELVIAEILGHVDTQNVKCYVAATPEIAQRLDKNLAKDLAPIANAFVGKILLTPADATRFDDASSQIIDYRNGGKQLGGCGTTYNCQFNAPIACYTCPKFEAWLDAPHAALYEQLEKEREEMFEVSGARLASVNDLTMIAIKNVIDECARIKSESTGDNRG